MRFPRFFDGTRGYSLSIRAQLLALVLAVLVPSGALITYLLIDSANTAVREVADDLANLAVQTASSIGYEIKDAQDVMERIAALPSVKKLDPSTCDQAFGVLPALRAKYLQLGLRDADGRIVCSFLPGALPIDPKQAPPWFSEGLRSGTFTASDAWFGRRTRQWVSVLTFPVRDDSNAVIGLIVLPLDLGELQKRELNHFTGNHVAAVFDRRGHFLMRSSDHEKWVGKSSATAGNTAQERRSLPVAKEMVGVDGVYRLRAGAKVPGTEWFAVVGLPKADILAAAKRQFITTFVVGLLILAGVAGLAHLLVRKISEPLRRLGSAARAIAGGDTEVHVEPAGSVELRAVTREFNRMVGAKVLLDRETHEHHKWASALIENASDLIVIIDAHGVIKYVSPSLKAMGEYEAHEAIGRNYLEFIHPDQAQASIEDLRTIAGTHDPVPLVERLFRHKDGRWIPLESIARNALEDPTIRGIVITARDVTERKRGVAMLARQKDLYEMLSQTNQAIVRTTSRDELFPEICRIAVQNGRFRFASIGLVDRKDARVRNAAQYCDESGGYLDTIEVSASPAEDIGRGPTGRAIRAGGHVVSNDFINDPATAPWREAAQRAGVRASGAFPIRLGGAVVGAINLYSADPGFFTEDILPTLDEMAVDVSFALDNFAREAERKRAERELEFHSAVLTTQQEASLDGILLVNENAKIISYNQRFVDLWHIPGELVKAGDDAPVLRSVLKDAADPEEFLARIQYLNDHKDEQARDEIVLKDGRIIDRYSAPMVGPDGHYYGRMWQFRDITERKDAEERIRRLNRVYAVLSGINSLIVRARDRQQLFTGACRIALEPGNFAMAWVGMLDSATRAVIPVAWAGIDSDIIARSRNTVLNDDPLGQGMLGRAVRENRAIFSNDLTTEPDPGGERRQEAVRRGYHSLICLPLTMNRAVVGTLALFAKEKNFFNDDEVRLLAELAGDISFALQTLQSEERRKEVEGSLAESEAKYRGLVEQDLTGIYIIQDGRFVYVNPHLAQIFGYDEKEVVGLEAWQLVAEPDRALVMDNVRKRIAGEMQSVQYTFRGQRKDGSWIDVGVHGSRAVYKGRPAVIGLLQDITERSRAEEQKQLYLTQIEQSMLGTIDAVSAMVEMRDPYTSGHERRVSEIAAAIATEMGLPQEDIKGLRVAGLVHDIGKIACPAEILSKPTRLTPLEYEMIKTHPQLGYDILKSVHFPWPIAQIVLQHHERCDGSGYPQGLKDEAILLGARIMAVADVVEAMSSHRPYRPGHGVEAALKEVEKQIGKLFDPQVAAACLRLFRDKNYTLPK